MLNGFSNAHHLTASQFDNLKDTNPEDAYFVSSVAVAGNKKETIPVVSGTAYNYTAPADGYVTLAATGNANTSVYLSNTTTECGFEHKDGAASYSKMTLRVAKGDVINMGFTGALTRAYFIYDK